jgi:hypothetical protein
MVAYATRAKLCGRNHARLLMDRIRNESKPQAIRDGISTGLGVAGRRTPAFVLPIRCIWRIDASGSSLSPRYALEANVNTRQYLGRHNADPRSFVRPAAAVL